MTPNKYIYEVSFILRYNFNENTPYEISIYKLCLQQANPTTFQCHIKQHYKLRFSQVQRHYEEIISYSDNPTQFFYFSKSFFSKKTSLILTEAINTIRTRTRYITNFATQSEKTFFLFLKSLPMYINTYGQSLCINPKNTKRWNHLIIKLMKSLAE